MRNIFGYIVWQLNQWEKETWFMFGCVLISIIFTVFEQPLIGMSFLLLIPIFGAFSLLKENLQKSYKKYQRIKEASEDSPL
jgi:hypothetical protein